MNKIAIVRLDRQRFNALAGLSRSPAAAYVSEELDWLSNQDETILGVVLRDTVDNDYVAIVLARDEAGRFRAFDMESSIETAGEARAWLERAIRWHTSAGVRAQPQSDASPSLDLFTPVHPPDRLHPDFIHLSNERALLPARSIIEHLMPHFEDVDGNFVEQFQSTGFDARLWELYLFQYLNEEELFLDRSHGVPDFLVTKYSETVAIEAVIVGRRPDNPPRYCKTPARPKTTAEVREAHADLIPMRFGSPLYSKLQKKYWELPQVSELPLVLAIADFHDDQSMLWTSTALINYLYGVRHEFHHDDAGRLVIRPVEIVSHKIGDKEIPSGFFFQPDAENISAVLSSATGTLSKFNRIGRQAGFRDPTVQMIRVGTCYNHDSSAATPNCFKYEVDERSRESWAEGLEMLHNPRAKHPIPEELFPSIAHHHFIDGMIESRIPDFHPYASVTYNLCIRE